MHSLILREVRLFVRILLAGVGCLVLAAALTLWASVWSVLLGLYLINNVLSPQQVQWVVVIKQGVSVKTLHGVDCHALFTPCEDWPDRDELKRLLAIDSDTIRSLKESSRILDVVISKSKCPGKAMLDVGYVISDIRSIGELIERLEEESGRDIPCLIG